jgi:hypothetical protein
MLGTNAEATVSSPKNMLPRTDDLLPADLVADARQQGCTQHVAEQRRTEDRPEIGALDIPIANDRGGRIGEDLDVVALDHHGGATKDENQARKPAS